MNKSALMNKYVAINKQCQGIQDYADLEGRELTGAEQAQIDSLMAEADKIENQINKMGGFPSAGRKSEPQQPMAQANLGGGHSRAAGPGAPAGYSQFKSPGDFFQAVKDSCARGGTRDPRLIMDAPSTSSSEGAGADGGFLVPPQWSRDIFSTIMGEGSLVDLCNVVPVTGNTYVQVLDTGAPWATSGGVQAYWKGEMVQLTESKVELKDTTKRLCKLTAVCPVTEELMEDAPSLDGYLRRKVASIFDFKINLAILQGVGAAGQPSGILPAPCLITVDKEAGQDADSVVYENIVKMWGRLAPGSENNAVWLMHKDVWPQLLTMGLVNGVSSTPVFLPADAAAGRPMQTLMGRPIVTTQAAETLGDKGDIILADLTQYQVILKTAGMRTQVSAHVYFLWDVQTFKFVIRIDGSPLWPAAVAARDGNNTYSPFVCLAERS
jgi:HK97 family phage major capsid protein